MRPTFLQLMMFGSGTCYVGSTVGWLIAGKPWMAATFALYALTILTLYMAGFD